MGIKLHPRYHVVREAEIAFSKFFLDLEQKHDLTYGEMFEILAMQQARLAKYLVRAERHPDTPDKPGDEA